MFSNVLWILEEETDETNKFIELCDQEKEDKAAKICNTEQRNKFHQRNI